MLSECERETKVHHSCSPSSYSCNPTGVNVIRVFSI